MKYSGVQWIGNIPDNWEVKKVKYCFYISKEQAHEENPTVLSLARSGVKVRDISSNEGQLAASYDNYNPVKPGDLLLNPMDLYSGANCNMSELSGVISPAYVNLRAKEELNPKFFDYFFKTQYWAMAMFAHGKGVSFDNRWTLNAEALLGYSLPFPKKEIQDDIVDYLNLKTNEIETLINIEKNQIEKLNEYKQAIITDAMTKGFDNHHLKDSGVAYIGQIESDLIVVPLKFLLSEQMMYGANESGTNDKTNNALRYIRITDIDGDGKLKDSEDNQYLPRTVGEPYLLEDGDVLFARSGGTVGKTFIYRSCYGDSAFAGYLIKAKCNKQKILSDYLYLFTQSSAYELWKQSIFIQSTIQNIGANKYSMLPVVVGSIDWQKKIVDYLNNKLKDIDSLIELKKQKIDELEEYKKSLIFEYVTGKKEVAA